MYQGFPGDYDSGSRCSSSPSAESQYLSSVDSFGSPAAAAAAQVRESEPRSGGGGGGGGRWRGRGGGGVVRKRVTRWNPP